MRRLFFGASGGVCGASWSVSEHLGRLSVRLGVFLRHLGGLLEPLGVSRVQAAFFNLFVFFHFGHFEAHFGPVLGRFGAHLGPQGGLLEPPVVP